jgi:hypothetical protein
LAISGEQGEIPKVHKFSSNHCKITLLKGKMKAIIAIVGALILLTSGISSMAIEGLQISVQSTNAVLSWPSTNIETYIVQYRSNLTASSSWQTLTDYYPAATSANITLFVNSNSVIYLPSGPGGTNGGGSINLTNTSSGSDTNTFVSTSGFYQVVRDGVHIFGLTNGMVLSGEIVTPIEYATGITDLIAGVALYTTNDVPIIGASSSTGPDGGQLLDWDTTQIPNGQYAIEAELNYASSNPVVSVPVTVTIDNPISFPNTMAQYYGSQMWIYAITVPNAAYELDIYGENTNYIGSFYGNADGGGNISFLWNFVDGSGISHSDTNFIGVYTVNIDGGPAIVSQVASPTNQFVSPVKKTMLSKGGPQPQGTSPTQTSKYLWASETAWVPNNKWVVCYASLTGDGTVDSRAVDMIVGGASSPTDYNGILGTLDPYGLNGNLSPGNNAQNGTVFTLLDSTTRTSLIGYLGLGGTHYYENFYFFGHANDQAISAYNAATTMITQQQLAYALGNVPLSFQNQHVAFHPYRFVWLDGCETAGGTMSQAFGIPSVPLSTNVFAAAGVESRAFLGYAKPIGFDDSNSSADPNSWPNHSILLAEFLSSWLGNVDNLGNLVNDAKTSFGNYGYDMDSSAVVYGAYDMFNITRTRP